MLGYIIPAQLLGTKKNLPIKFVIVTLPQLSGRLRDKSIFRKNIIIHLAQLSYSLMFRVTFS